MLEREKVPGGLFC